MLQAKTVKCPQTVVSSGANSDASKRDSNNSSGSANRSSTNSCAKSAGLRVAAAMVLTVAALAVMLALKRSSGDYVNYKVFIPKQYIPKVITFVTDQGHPRSRAQRIISMLPTSAAYVDQ
jgi:hypothetical protein